MPSISNAIFPLFVSIIFVSGKPAAGPIDDDAPLWIENLANNDDGLQDYQDRQIEIYGMFPPDRRLVKDGISRFPTDNFNEIAQASWHKRALTMFGRWGPINDFGKERSSIRSSDRMHPSTGRKLGQPFRWG